MSRLLLTVKEVFAVGRLGVVVSPGPLAAEYDGPFNRTARLKRPSGEERTAQVRLEQLFVHPTPTEFRLGCRLPSTKLEEVPLGTEIWLDD